MSIYSKQGFILLFICKEHSLMCILNTCLKKLQGLRQYQKDTHTHTPTYTHSHLWVI